MIVVRTSKVQSKKENCHRNENQIVSNHTQTQHISSLLAIEQE